MVTIDTMAGPLSAPGTEPGMKDWPQHRFERLLVVTDTWEPQVNGVVRTIDALRKALAVQGCAVSIIEPGQFASLPMPSYPELRLGLVGRRRMARAMMAHAPQSVHIATEGPLGWAARAACRTLGWAYTTAFHTRFPDYVHARSRLPRAWTWALLRRFHAPSQAVLAATSALGAELAGHGFNRVERWGRGVDAECFRPSPRHGFDGLPRPVFLHVGRLAVEKNIEAFLSLDLPGSKVVIGDGPIRARLQRRYPDAHFLGPRPHGALAQYYAGSDVLVFPSRTDTFGLVLLEALACGTPVAAFPSPALSEMIGAAPVGDMATDLRSACLAALELDRADCRRFAEGASWTACADSFLSHMVPVRP
jgi:glycosyltransferase involved in cell wall biosynthesis